MKLYSKCNFNNCNKKILSVSSKCKCNNNYCPIHKFNHICSHNYHEEHKNKLKNNNPVIQKPKLIHI